MMRTLLLGTLLLACSFCRAQAPAAPSVPNAEVRTRLNVADARLNESSGLGASRSNAGYLWTHNDSGDSARAFLVSPKGNVRLEVTLRNAQNRDWEDMAAANGWVYCADIGDNENKHPSVTVYRFREPKLSSATPAALELSYEAVTLRFPDGAQDAETFLARRDGTLMIVSKGFLGSAVYETPQPFRDGATMTLRKLADVSFEADGWRGLLATGGDISPDEKRVTLTTYTRLYEWTLPKGANRWSKVWQTSPRVYQLPKLRQIEGVCYSKDGKSRWVSSEGTPMPLLQIAAEK